MTYVMTSLVDAVGIIRLRRHNDALAEALAEEQHARAEALAELRDLAEEMGRVTGERDHYQRELVRLRAHRSPVLAQDQPRFPVWNDAYAFGKSPWHGSAEIGFSPPSPAPAMAECPDCGRRGLDDR